MSNIRQYLIQKSESIKNALKLIDKNSRKIVFAIDIENKLYGALTDGNIRRWIIKTSGIEGKVEDICDKNPIFFLEGYSIEQVKEIMFSKGIEAVPVVDNERKIIKILFWNDIFKEEREKFTQINLPVVIMAGGKGTRLDPFTRILPKPLIPFNNKAIIEVIMDEYSKFGMKKFYISINYKAKIIKAYFEEQKSNYNFEFIEEDNPLGTAGALKFLEKKVNTSFFVSNCDTIIKEDYSKIYNFHKENNFVLTIVGSMQHHTIPYGVCEIKNGGKLKKIIEKPVYDFLANTGMYLLNSEVLYLIPHNKFYNITDLVSILIENNHKVGVYPISEKSWIDIGQWWQYNSNFNKMLF